MANKVAVTASMSIHPDRIDATLALVRRFQDDSRQFAGLLVVRARHDPRDQARLMFYTEFESREAADGYLSWRRDRGDIAHLSEMLVEPLQAHSWSTVIEPT